MTLKGIGVSRGIAIGKVLLKKELKLNLAEKKSVNVDEELVRFKTAQSQVLEELKEVCKTARLEHKEDKAMIFEAHQMIAEDVDYIEHIMSSIKGEEISAESAVAKASEVFEAIFRNMDNDYMKERALDIKDVSNRLLSMLSGETAEDLTSLKEPVIIAARDLLPSDTIQMDRRYVMGIITEEGGQTSHAAILARSMGIPAAMGIQSVLQYVKQNEKAALDGRTGEITIAPSDDELKAWQVRKEEYDQYIKNLQLLKGTPNKTKDGVPVHLNANIASPDDIQDVLENEAEGVGLFRSEFLYMHKDKLPSEEEQFAAYKKVLESIKGKVIIRTLDAGGDKEIPALGVTKDENPFLGYRAIRLCLGKREVFYTQIRALLRASIYGSLGIMFPMISSLEEVREAKKMLKEVEADLESCGIPFAKDIEIGMMIETPAAVMLSDLFAKEVQFFSIGTNDLTQYMMAVDRMNPRVAYLYDTHNPAVLRAIKTAAENAHKAGIWIGICGEAAADTSLLPFFLKIGIDELSVSANAILQVRERLQSIDTRESVEEII